MSVDGHNGLEIRTTSDSRYVRLEVLNNWSSGRETVLSVEEAIEVAARLIYYARRIK